MSSILFLTRVTSCSLGFIYLPETRGQKKPYWWCERIDRASRKSWESYDCERAQNIGIFVLKHFVDKSHGSLVLCPSVLQHMHMWYGLLHNDFKGGSRIFKRGAWILGPFNLRARSARSSRAKRASGSRPVARIFEGGAFIKNNLLILWRRKQGREAPEGGGSVRGVSPLPVKGVFAFSELKLSD